MKKSTTLKLELLVFFLFVLSRLPALGLDNFNTDVWKWKSRSYDFSTGIFTLDFEKTIQKYHPGVTLMWVGTAGIKFFNLYHDAFYSEYSLDNNIYNIFGLDFTQKLLLVCAIGLVLACVFRALRMLFTTKLAAIAVFLLALEPMYVGLTRVFHLEGLMSTLMVASFVYLYWHLVTNSKKYIVYSAIFASFAVLTKTSALFMLPFSLLMIAIHYYLLTGNNKITVEKLIRPFGTWLLTYVLVFVLFWPAMYTHASLALQTLYTGIFTVGIEESHAQLYFGKLVDDPGIFYYFVVLYYRTSIFLLGGLFGLFVVRKKLTDEKAVKFIMYALLFCIFYFIEHTIPSKKLDRYILPVILMLVLIGAFYYDYLFSKAKNMWFLVVFLLVPMLTLVYLHPDYLSYYSPLGGGLKKGIHVIEPKWMIGQREIVSFFEEELRQNKKEPFAFGESFDAHINQKSLKNKLTIGFQEKYYTQIWPFIEKIGGRATIKDITAQAKESNYFVYPVYSDDSNTEDRFVLDPVGTINLRGVKLYNVYRRVYTD